MMYLVFFFGVVTGYFLTRIFDSMEDELPQ